MLRERIATELVDLIYLVLPFNFKRDHNLLFTLSCTERRQDV